MRTANVKLFARQVYTGVFTNKAVAALLIIIALLIAYALYSGLLLYRQQTKSIQTYQQQVRAHWEAMPDKHPHRMAHYGYIAFRHRHLLSFFDRGMESYTGNAVFLEAHRQNSVNLSEAGLSSGILRFGEIHTAMILQILLPLALFFTGFSTVAADRENGTLKILLSQGATWKEIIAGKALGLLGIALTLLLPVIATMVITCLALEQPAFVADDLLRIGWLGIAYTLYFGIIALVAVIVSAVSRSAKLALVSLMGIWLLLAVVLPRTAQATGQHLFGTPSKIAFNRAVEKELLATGDSHNPDDPYYKALKDSVLKAHNADSIQQLPFNYSGFQMREGERLSAELYNRHLFKLWGIYEKQNAVSEYSALINPFVAIRNFSMAISGTGFHDYIRFQQQAEAYRYRLAQHMNELQMQYISNQAQDKPQAISQAFWKQFPDFTYERFNTPAVVTGQGLPVIVMLWWIAGLLLLVQLLSNKLKAI